MSDSPINPYAPATPDQTDGQRPRMVISGGLSSFRVCTQTIGSVGAAGAIHGVGMLLFVMSYSQTSPVSFSVHGDFPLLMLTVMVSSLVWATIAAVPVVLVAFLLANYLSERGRPWSARGVRSFAASSGFGSGALSVFTLYLFSGGMTVYGLQQWLLLLVQCLVPATVGAVITLLLMEPLSRRAGREIELREELIAEHAGAEKASP